MKKHRLLSQFSQWPATAVLSLIHSVVDVCFVLFGWGFFHLPWAGWGLVRSVVDFVCLLLLVFFACLFCFCWLVVFPHRGPGGGWCGGVIGIAGLYHERFFFGGNQLLMRKRGIYHNHCETSCAGGRRVLWAGWLEAAWPSWPGGERSICCLAPHHSQALSPHAQHLRLSLFYTLVVDGGEGAPPRVPEVTVQITAESYY